MPPILLSAWPLRRAWQPHSHPTCFCSHQSSISRSGQDGQNQLAFLSCFPVGKLPWEARQSRGQGWEGEGTPRLDISVVVGRARAVCQVDFFSGRQGSGTRGLLLAEKQLQALRWLRARYLLFPNTPNGQNLCPLGAAEAQAPAKCTLPPSRRACWGPCTAPCLHCCAH